jgi:hypothetical protein
MTVRDIQILHRPYWLAALSMELFLPCVTVIRGERQLPLGNFADRPRQAVTI